MADLRSEISARRRRVVLAIAIGAIALDTALLGLIAPLLPEIEDRVGASEAELGIALGAYALPILFVSLPFGRLADRLGRRPLLLGGLLMTVVGSIVIAEAPSLPLLVLGRSIQGVGSAASWIAALALVSELAPPDRKGEAIGYALAANSVGAIAGPALGGILGDAAGFAFPFFLVAGIGAGIAVAGWLALPHEGRREGTGETRARDLLALAVSRPVLPATMIVAIASGALGVVEVVAPLDADERLGLSASTIGIVFAATIALDAIAAPFGGREGDRRGRGVVSLAGLVLMIAAMGLLSWLGGIGGLLVGLAVYGVGSSIVFAAAVPWLDDAFGAVDRGFGYGFLNLIYSAGYTVGPIVAGVALQIAGPGFAYGLQATGLIAVAALAWARRGEAPAVANA
jgi:MFS transporter, DHA1 family, solute carrier family 18 (vesicular amine transporter), member 1/2